MMFYTKKYFDFLVNHFIRTGNEDIHKYLFNYLMIENSKQSIENSLGLNFHIVAISTKETLYTLHRKSQEQKRIVNVNIYGPSPYGSEFEIKKIIKMIKDAIDD